MQIRLVTDRAQPVIFQDGKRYLQFAGTSYLGMGSLPEFVALVKEGIDRHGINHGSSRGSNVQLGVYGAFEHFFSNQAGAEDACLVSSGYLSGQLAVDAMLPHTDLWWVSPDAHPAILPRGKSGDSRQSFDSWAASCVDRAKTLLGQRIAIVANAVDPLAPRVHNFGWLEQLPPVNEYTVLIDDSHAFGIVGPGCFGTYRRWNKAQISLLVCGSLGKALGLPAGIVLADALWIKRMRDNRIFRSSSPPAPAPLHAFLQGQSLYYRQRTRLEEVVYRVANELETNPFCYTADGFPVVTFSPQHWVESLACHRIVVSSFAYPDPTDTPVNRVVLSAAHLDEDVDYLISRLNSLAKS
ncbi:Aminotransferase, class II [Lunatimonas lonarensis]|uniref:Aminotransferase, class II n=1 Tax=Lunatimonas lonarensis TaxID=1232681 RepID=R7ZMG0_9BACT|nr:aminotransferase class I/II-fold pyridoxal phosphate-dependent enzyme [Lunatimonas lonarensis]EON75194.1 Aminotransferase, class II [Lunatimonas lonarensis]